MVNTHFMSDRPKLSTAINTHLKVKEFLWQVTEQAQEEYSIMHMENMLYTKEYIDWLIFTTLIQTTCSI